MNEQEYNRSLLMDRVIYFFVMIGTIALIMFSIFFAYSSMNPQRKTPMPLQEESQETVGKKKQLPDYIVDKVTPDELEILKP